MFKALSISLMILVMGAATAQSANRAGEGLPNVIFFFADDLGWGDVGRYHESYADGVNQPATAPVPTPNMNRLCDEGMMFTDAHLPAALCAPNRFCVMTGSNPHRSRSYGTWNRTASSAFYFGAVENDRLANPHRTVGTVLQDAGYRTAYLGKMHFGGDFYDSSGNLLRDLANDQLDQIDYSRRFDNGLLDHGFDYTFVTPDGIQGPVYAYFENDRYRPLSDFAAEVNGVDVSATSYLRSFSNGDTVGNGEMIADGYGDSEFDTSEHGPILAHFACQFIDEHVLNHPDKPFMLFYAAPAIHTPITPSITGIEAAGVTGLGGRPDFIFDLDAQLGLLLDKLDELGIGANTIVIVSSDNGGFEDAAGDGAGQAAAGQDANGPFNGGKGSIYEGGHRVPFIWRWGDGTAGGSIIPPGIISTQLVSVIDWVPSMIDLVGGSVAADQHYDSVSLLPLLFSDDPDGEQPVRTFHHFLLAESEVGGVRMNDAEGAWFLKRNFNGSGAELYNLTTDITQQTDLIDSYDMVGSVPNDHPQKSRITTMNAWYTAHNNTNEPRTTVARDYTAPAQEPGLKIVSVNLTFEASDEHQIDVGETFGIAIEQSIAGSWVNLAGNNASDLIDDDGVGTTVDISITTPNPRSAFHEAYADTPLRGGITAYTSNLNPTFLTLSDLNATYPSGYWVIAYVCGFTSNDGAGVSDGNTTYVFRPLDAPSASISFVQTADETDNGSGTAPDAQYAVFGSPYIPLTANTVTLTIEALHGGGAGICGVQIIGREGVTAIAKTVIPVPVPDPQLTIDASDMSLGVTGLEPEINYELQRAGSLGEAWNMFDLIPAGTGDAWNSPNDVIAGELNLYRLKYADTMPRYLLTTASP